MSSRLLNDETQGKSSDRKVRSMLVNFVSRELVFQGYVASRLTGITPSNVKRSVRSSLRSRYFIAVPFAFILLISIFEGKIFIVGRNPLFYPLAALTWLFMSFFISVIQLSYGASAGPQVREFLMTLPLDAKEIERIAAGSIFSAMKVSLITSGVILLAAGFILGQYMMLAGIFAAIISISLSLMAVSLIVGIYRKLGATSRTFGFVRIIMTIPIVLLSLSFGYFQTTNINLNYFESTFVPVLNLAGVGVGNSLSVIFAFVYTLAFAFLGYYSFRRSSVALLSPLNYVASKMGRFRVRIRSPTVALALSDFRQIFRSPGLVGFIIVPFIYVTITLFRSFISPPASQGGSFVSEIQFVTDVVPVVALCSFLAYVLYLTEMKALVYFQTLPLGKFTNVKSKLFVTLLFYGVVALIMGLSFTYVSNEAIILAPLAAFSITVAACVLYTSVFFRYAAKSLTVGAIGLLNQTAYTIIDFLLFCIPAAVYVAGLFVTRSYIAPLPYLVGISLAELFLMIYLIFKGS